jgi:hypothetical protein
MWKVVQTNLTSYGFTDTIFHILYNVQNLWNFNPAWSVGDGHVHPRNIETEEGDQSEFPLTVKDLKPLQTSLVPYSKG